MEGESHQQRPHCTEVSFQPKIKKSKTDFTALVGLTMQMYSGPAGHFFTVFINGANLPQCHLPRPPHPQAAWCLEKRCVLHLPAQCWAPQQMGTVQRSQAGLTHTRWGFVPSQADKIKHCHSVCPSQTRRGTRSTLKAKQTLPTVENTTKLT